MLDLSRLNLTDVILCVVDEDLSRLNLTDVILCVVDVRSK